MKKILLASILLFVLILPSYGESVLLQLRSSQHPNFTRIVIEGPDSEISKAIVNQSAVSVSVKFPDSVFSVDADKMDVLYRTADENTLMFFPGKFRGLKVFTLKYPSRLVIDVQKEEQTRKPFFFFEAPESISRTGPEKTRSIVIDPGHGGYDSGIINGDNIEKHVVLDISRKLLALLNSTSSENHLTRGSDRFMSQKERIEIAGSRNADIFISLHVGSSSGIVIYVPAATREASDIERQYLYNKGQEEYAENTASLLYAMKEAMTGDFGDNAVSVRSLNYSFLSGVNAASLMIELPSFEDAEYIEEFRADLAKSINRGLYIYEEIKAN